MADFHVDLRDCLSSTDIPWRMVLVTATLQRLALVVLFWHIDGTSLVRGLGRRSSVRNFDLT